MKNAKTKISGFKANLGWRSTRSAPSPITDALAGALILAVSMGFGRFSFTGMYPLMVNEGRLTIFGGSLAASANYLGYLVGALMMSRVHHRHSARLCGVAMIGTVLCLAALQPGIGVPYILAIRSLAGVFSAVAMVAASTWLLQVLGYHKGTPILFSGVGAGILVSAELIAVGDRSGLHSAKIWNILAIAAAMLCALAWMRMRREPDAPIPERFEIGSTLLDTGRAFRPGLLLLIYGLSGFGYIVTATYLPLFVKNALRIDPIQIWAAFGLGAIPSCFLWHVLHEHLGSRRALLANLIVQAAGVLLPAVSAMSPAFLASAVLVGATFAGTATIVMAAAKRIAVTVRYNIMAALTAAYGIGQIAGPMVSNELLTDAHSLNPPLVVAGGSLLVAALTCLL